MLRAFAKTYSAKNLNESWHIKCIFLSSEDKLSLPIVAKWILIIWICNVDGSELKNRFSNFYWKQKLSNTLF